LQSYHVEIAPDMIEPIEHRIAEEVRVDRRPPVTGVAKDALAGKYRFCVENPNAIGNISERAIGEDGHAVAGRQERLR